MASNSSPINYLQFHLSNQHTILTSIISSYKEDILPSRREIFKTDADIERIIKGDLGKLFNTDYRLSLPTDLSSLKEEKRIKFIECWLEQERMSVHQLIQEEQFKFLLKSF